MFIRKDFLYICAFLINNATCPAMFKTDFIQNAKRLLSDEYEALETALSTDPPVSIRINPWKGNDIILPLMKGDNSQLLSGTKLSINAEWERVPWCKTGYYLPERPVFTCDPLFHAGVYYVQEASSMFLEQAILTIVSATITTNHPVTALDLCAAPGGKSTHLLSLLPENSLLVCNEVIRSRNLVLSENIAKWGRSNAIITQNDPQHFGDRLPHFFDIILADLPCSGEGLFRKEPAARNEWSMENVKMCAARQRRIVRDAWEALKPGGYLIYSTCTFNTEENEENIKTLSDELGAEIIPIPVKPTWKVSGALHHDMPAYRFFPYRTRGEGFFLALIKKTATGDSRGQTKEGIQATGDKRRKSDDRRGKTGDKRQDFDIYKYLNVPSNSEIFLLQANNQAIAIPQKYKNTFSALSERLNIRSAGLPLGEWKGADFIPSAALALSTELNPRAFPSIALSYEQAIAYLRKETIILPADAPKGHLLATFQNTPLGFIKNVGTRVNNLYPREWRIRGPRIYTNLR